MGFDGAGERISFMSDLANSPARVAHAFRVLVAVFHRNELSWDRLLHEAGGTHEKFATVEHRRQPTRRGRYPEGLRCL